LENVILSLNVVVPLFIMIALGYLAKHFKFYDEKGLQAMNKLIYKIFLPVTIFNNITNVDLSQGVNVSMMAYTGIAMFFAFLLCFIVVPLINKERKQCGALIQGICRSNFVIFGMPLSQMLFPQDTTGAAAMLVAVAIPIGNMMSVIALEYFRGGKVDIKKILIGIITNPLIIGCLLGIAFLLLDIPIPKLIKSPISDLGKVSGPLALFLLGGSIHFEKIKGNIKPLIMGVAGKLVIIPAIFVSIAALLGFRGVALAAIMVVFVAPTAVNSYTLAQMMDADSELASEIVVFTTAFSILSIFLWIFVMKQLMLF